MSIITKIRLFKYLEVSAPKTENFQIKNVLYVHISAQNKCGYSLEPPRRGGSNEYPQNIYFFLAERRKNNVYPGKPQFYHIKVGFKGVKII